MSASSEIAFFVINSFWVIANICQSVIQWKRAKVQARHYAEKMAEAETIHDEALALAKFSRLAEYRVCPTCQKIVPGLCPDHPIVLSIPN